MYSVTLAFAAALGLLTGPSQAVGRRRTIPIQITVPVSRIDDVLDEVNEMRASFDKKIAERTNRILRHSGDQVSDDEEYQ